MTMRLALLLATTLLCPPALAQSIPAIGTSGRATGQLPPAGTPESTRVDLGIALGTKADAVGGVLTNPTINGGTWQNPIIAGGTFSATPAGGSVSLALASMLGYVDNIFAYGAICNDNIANAAADTRAIAAALAHRATLGGDVYIPPSLGCRINATLSVQNLVHLVGDNVSSAHLHAAAANLNMVSIDGSGSGLRGMEINPSTLATATSGTAVSTTALASNAEIEDVNINVPCHGLDINGNTITARRVYINLVLGAGCAGVRVGNLTTGANTVNTRLFDVTVAGYSGNQPDAGLEILDSGGLLADQVSIAFAGTIIRPGHNQVVEWFKASHSHLADTTPTTGLVIDTADSSGAVQGLTFVDDWISSSTTGFGTTIANSGGGKVDGVHFSHLQAYNNASTGLVNSGGSHVTVDDSYFCGQAGAAGDITVSVGFSIAVRGTAFGKCDGFAPNGSAVGITLQGSNPNVVITGNDFSASTVPISGNPIGDSVVSENTIVSTEGITVASAATIALINASETYVITGTATINTMTGGWGGRKVKLLTSGAVTFTGGNICAPYTSPAGAGLVAASYFGCWYLK